MAFAAAADREMVLGYLNKRTELVSQKVPSKTQLSALIYPKQIGAVHAVCDCPICRCEGWDTDAQPCPMQVYQARVRTCAPTPMLILYRITLCLPKTSSRTANPDSIGATERGSIRAGLTTPRRKPGVSNPRSPSCSLGGDLDAKKTSSMFSAA